jgi:lysine 2,3-aminomutase
LKTEFFLFSFFFRAALMYPQDKFTNWTSGQGRWESIAPDQWNSWQWQVNQRITNVEELRTMMQLTEDEEQGCAHAHQRLSLAITPHFFNLIDTDNPNCPIRRQVIPSAKEMITVPEEHSDPLGEEKDMPVSSLIHRYPDRVLLLATSHCASYCRYCMRGRLVSNAQGYQYRAKLEPAFDYIEKHPEIRDVLISGGDPLLLPDSQIRKILTRLRQIDHIEFIRIGTRIPFFMPQRITDDLCQIFKEFGPIYLSLHSNHPKECTLEFKEACDKLLCSKTILSNQSVLLKGINDDAETLLSLNHRLLRVGVRPYYLFQGDLIPGSHHLRTSVEKGLEIIEKMQGHTSGYAVPRYAIDGPGGGGKIPLLPNAIEGIKDNKLILRNYEGKLFSYPLSPSKL